jgi:small-conductance mechanosensitive channel
VDEALAEPHPARCALSANPAPMDWNTIIELLREPLFTMGETPITIAKLLELVAVVIVSVLVARIVRKVLRNRVLSRTLMDVGMQYALARIAGYVTLMLGLLVGLSTVGIDLTSLTVLIGALGVGIGFGLQNIINNFVSGLVILFERPFAVGHRVEVGETAGKVLRIGARSTTIVTNENIALIIPNSEFISGRVVNWSMGGDRRVRFHIPVGVSYGSSPRAVERLLLEVAAQNDDVLKEPKPQVTFKRFGDSSIDFELRVWTVTQYERPQVLASALYFKIWDIFKANDIEIPFPQRDVHIQEPLNVRVSNE